MTYDEWKAKLNALDDKINSLKVWDGYAQDLQIQYDRLLQDRPS